MSNANALDTTISVVTPENIAFDYQLAGPFRRLPAYIIDVLTRYAILGGILFVMWLFLGMVIGFSGATILGSFGSAVSMIVIFFFNQFYGTLLETYWNGRTVGKRAMGIRVIDIDGGPIDIRRAFLRNLLRVVDMMPFVPLSGAAIDLPLFGALTISSIGLICILFTKRMQRLGDLAAGTMVIDDERSWRLPIAKVDDARVPALASFIPGDYKITRTMAKTLAIYAERRHYLTPPRRREICRHLVYPLLDRFEFREDIDPDLLMYALYYKTFLAEPDETPNLGPLAGYSPLRKDINKIRGSANPGPAAIPNQMNKTAATSPAMAMAAASQSPPQDSGSSDNPNAPAEGKEAGW